MTDLRSLARALGGEAVGGQLLCPGPGHSPRDRSLSLRLSAAAPNGFVVYSHAGDDWRDCLDHVRARLGIERSRRRDGAVRAVPNCRARRLEIVRRIVGEISPLAGTIGERYLAETRHIDAEAIADVLGTADAVGWHPAVYFNEPGHSLHDRRLGCIVGVMTDPKTALPTGAISRTYVDSDLRKIGKAKTLGSPTGVIRVSPDTEALGGLFLSEGLETALAAMSIGLRPIWATVSTAIMSAFPVLSGIEAITVLPDHDANGAGERAARGVERRWRRARREARILRSNRLGDFNDVL